MQKKFTIANEGDYWSVIDTTLRDDSNLVYEDVTEFEAQTIVEILNNSDADLTFDQVCADWRWAVLVKIESLEAMSKSVLAKAHLLQELDKCKEQV